MQSKPDHSSETDLPLIRDHHEVDDRLESLLSALPGGDVHDIYEQLDMFWARLAVHIRAEHLHLFPVLTDGRDADDQRSKVIEELRRDHSYFMRELGKAIKMLRPQLNLADGAGDTIAFVEATLRRVATRLRRHNEIEEEHVYRWVKEDLTPGHCASLIKLIVNELDNMPPRLADADR